MAGTYTVTLTRIFVVTSGKDGPVPDYAPHLGPCWLWTGALGNGSYAYFGISTNRAVSAHRWSYEYACGSVPKGLELDHLCRIRHCVNPNHLEAVSKSTNVRRATEAKGRTACPKGHAYAVYSIFDKRNKRICTACDWLRDWNRSRKHSGPRSTRTKTLFSQLF